MNRIFKVVWSKARNCYVVASEFAKSRTKSGRAVKAVAMAAAVALTVGVNGLALAADIPTGTVSIGGDMAIGNGSVVKASDGSSSAQNSMAIGNQATVEGQYSLAIGAYSVVSRGLGAIALGVKAMAEGVTSIAIGNGTESYRDSIAIGANSISSGLDSISIGINSSVSKSGAGDVVIGRGASSTGYGNIVMGDAAKGGGWIFNSDGAGGGIYQKDTSVSIVDSVVIGPVAEALGNGSYGVSIGNHSSIYGKYGIAIGYESDALDESNIAIGNNAIANNGATYSVALGAYSETNATASTALGGYQAIANGAYSTVLGSQASSAKAASYSIAIGNSSQTNATQSIAIGGYQAITDGAYSTVVGSWASSDSVASYGTAIGYNSHSNATQSTAIGSNSKTNAAQSIAVGYNTNADGKNSTVVGSWASSNSTAEYSIAMGYNSKSLSKQSIAIGGYKAQASGEKSVAIGSNSNVAGVNNVALGASSSDKIGDDILLGGYGAGNKDYTGENLVFGTSDGKLDLNASSFTGIGGSVIGTVSVGYTTYDANNEKVINTRTLTNVAAGMISKDSTDAINGSQLYAVADALNTKVENLPEQKHTVNGNDKKAGEAADAPVVNNGQYVGGNLLIKADQDTATGDITYDISLNKNLTGLESITVNNMTVNNELKVGKTVSISDNSVKFGNVEIKNDYITNVKTDINNNSSVVNVESLNKEINKITNIIDDLNIPNNQQHTVNGNDNANNPGHGTAPTNDGKYNETGNLLINQNVAADGTVTYDISLNKDLTVNNVTSNNFYAGDTVINNNGITIGKGNKNIQITNDYVSFGDRVINNVVTDGKDGHEVVNIDYLEKYVNNYVTNHSDDTDTHIKEGEYSVGTVALEDGSETQGVQMDIVDKAGNPVKDEKGNNKTVTITDVAKASDVGDVKNFNQDVLNQDGSKTTVVDAINNIDNRVTEIDNKVTNIDNRVTNIEDNIDDIAKEAGKHTEVTVEGGDAPKYGEGYVGGNLQLKVDKGANGQDIYDVKLNNNLDLTGDGSIKFGDKNTYIDGDSINVGDTHITNNKIVMGNKEGDTIITDNSVNIGNTTVNNNGLTIKGDENHTDITINQGDVSMGGNVIHNVAPGVKDDDAVNVSQLKELNQNIENNSYHINKLKGRIDKVGAGAAALAALHPLDFDPDDKFYLSAGYGHYRGENAVSVGAFYQPNDDTLFSIASTVGNDDEMINAGITWRFGQQSHQSRSKKAMAKEIIELRTEIAELKAMVYSLTGYGLDLEKSKLFPDTPENHWAYDYVAVVAGNGILEGYPDGYFDGDRPMTRYEMAAVVYRLLQKGVQVDNRMIQEFAPELARVRVDTLTHYNDGTPHIQRVRVIKGRG